MVNASRPWLIGMVWIFRLSRGSTTIPIIVPPIRNKAMRAINPSTSVNPAPDSEPVSAVKIDNPSTTRTSSNTAAPSRPMPTLLRSTPSSIKVCAEMLTLVAESTNPRNTDAIGDMPNSSPAPIPNPSGKITPNVPESAAKRPVFARSLRCSSIPARNISSRTPTSASSWMVTPRC